MENNDNYLDKISKENEEKAKPKLYKESSFKGDESDPITRIKKEDFCGDSNYSSDVSEEEKDVVMEGEDKMGDLPMPKSNFSKPPAKKFTGQVKPSNPDYMQDQLKVGKKPGRNYDPITWDNVFDERELVQSTIPVYFSGKKGPVIFCIHGAGHSALSFGPFAKACKDFARVVSFDIRGHGGHQLADETNMPIDILIEECMQVLEYVIHKYQDASIIICGHSLGGALAAKLTYNIVHPEEEKDFGFDKTHIKGCFVIDVAEGSALSALPFMEQIVENRPTSFTSVSEAIKWGVMSGQVKNLESARVTMPDLIKEENGEFIWNTNLLASKDNWREWFTGMNKCFLDLVLPKTLVIASNDRMDKELTIAQMQGKFKLVSMFDVGHTIHEDAPEELASKFKDFIQVFGINEKYNLKKTITNAAGKEIVIDH
jgi:protein phosphatase methylesterase 1